MILFRHGIIEIYDSISTAETMTPPGVALIAARKMWPSTRGGDSVVAVLDTGIDYEHPDLSANVIGGESFVPGEPGYMDQNGHGTHVAGTIAANGYLLGVAPEAQLLAVKVLNKNGMGSILSINQGLAWARKWRGENGEKVNVINMSLGASVSNSDLHREIITTVEEGITVVCAAGNAGDGQADTTEISYPAYYPETIAVGAVDLLTGIANFSNSNERIDIVAPGVDTYSTFPGSRYVKLSGTSMAAPQISGSVALIYSRYKKRFGEYPLPDTVKDLLHYQAVDLGEIEFDNLYGYGLFSFNIDGAKAIRLIIGKNKYLVNSKEAFLGTAPFLLEGEACASISEICEILSTDSNMVPADGSEDNMQGQVEIWS